MSSKAEDENGPVFRKIDVNLAKDTLRKPLANSISTTKYTWYSWLPKSIWEQFRRIANIYFLLISILMLIGTYATYLFISPLDPFSTIVTLIFVLLVTSIKEGVEDLARGRSDQFENMKDVTVVTFTSTGEIVETVKKSKDINAGDIIKLTGKTAVPADMVLILTSLYGDGNKCYIETANIDGETNLKVKEAPPMLIDYFQTQISRGTVASELFEGALEIEPPNKNIHYFVGTLNLKGGQGAIPLGPSNILLRSSMFENTDWGYGIAIYTGQETKIQMNNRKAPSKMSKLEANLNMAIIIIFISQCILVSFSVISIYIMGFQTNSKLPYVFPPGTGTGSVLPLWLEQWFVFFLLYNNFIPISLYVTIELVNVGQAFLIGSDELIYHEGLNMPCTVRASNLVQELGMVSNIFSDKTGTLTRNEMKLVKFVLNGQVYDVDYSTIDFGSDDSSNVDVSAILSQFGPNKKTFIEFCRCLSTCHTVVREKNGTYRAESPDELALIEGMAPYCCGLKERGSKEMIVKLFGERRTYEILAVNPFNSDRKRMSTLLRDVANNKYILMCKGADNIMMPLCKLSDNDISGINKSLLDMANMGLRTLIVASKELTEEEAHNWLATYKAASIATNDRDGKIAAAAASLEIEMNCIGVTAIEDRLQDEVPEVIADLAKAGIILWMLTGDKLETAINIGHSCNLLLHDTTISMLTKISSGEEFVQRLDEEYDKVCGGVRNPNTALVLDGPSFSYFDVNDPIQRKKMLEIGQSCRSVIACRLTPTQKRELVHLVKTETKPSATTLAIGDGANDVSMILEGNVGVGIFGKEGRQAANNADFAIGEFKFLRRLLLLHGRWNYIRQSKVFLYSMHKNMVLTLTLFWYSFYDAVSGTSLYESWVYTSFNFVLGLPIIFFGIMDRDLNAPFVLSHPQVYVTGLANKLLKVDAIGVWIFNAVLYGVVINLLFYMTLQPTYANSWGLYDTGTMVFTGLCNALQLKVAFFHHQWAWPNIFVMAISVGGMLLYFYILSAVELDFLNVANHLYNAEPIFWFFGFFTIPFIVIYIDVIGYYTKVVFMPTEEMVFKEIEVEIETKGNSLNEAPVGQLSPVALNTSKTIPQQNYKSIELQQFARKKG